MRNVPYIIPFLWLPRNNKNLIFLAPPSFLFSSACWGTDSVLWQTAMKMCLWFAHVALWGWVDFELDLLIFITSLNPHRNPMRFALILYTRKLSLKEVKELPQDHKTNKEHSWISKWSALALIVLGVNRHESMFRSWDLPVNLWPSHLVLFHDLFCNACLVSSFWAGSVHKCGIPWGDWRVWLPEFKFQLHCLLSWSLISSFANW